LSCDEGDAKSNKQSDFQQEYNIPIARLRTPIVCRWKSKKKKKQNRVCEQKRLIKELICFSLKY
jgi:hypothetical protein